MTQNCRQANQGPELAKKEYYLEETLTIPYFFIIQECRGVYVHKFKIQAIQYLLSYRVVGHDLELIMIGHHENYYRDLNTYLKRR